MKHVPRLLAEPSSLAVHRAANPAADLAPPEQAEEVWNAFRDDVGYKDLLQVLIDVQQGLCIYCEQRLVDATGTRVFADYQVEHVLAKSGGEGRTLNWTNLAAACSGGTYAHHKDLSRRRAGRASESCGQRKGDLELAAACDPRGFPLSPSLVDIGQDGKATPNPHACNAHGVSNALLAATINDLLNLNAERLRVARQKVFDNLRTWLVPLLKVLLEDAHLTDSQRRQGVELLVAGRLQPDANGYLHAFWTTERCALGPAGEAWLAQHHADFV